MIPSSARTLPDARWSCRGCGTCCRVLALGPVDPTWVAESGAVSDLLPAGVPLVEARLGPDGKERLFLTRGTSGACVFRDDAVGCRIHAALGEAAKPAFCRVFPLDLVCDPLGAALVVLPTCAGHHRSAFDGEPLARQMAPLLALPHPVRSFAPPVVEVLPGQGISLEDWCAVEPRLLSMAAAADESPERAVMALRDALVRGTGRVLPGPDPLAARRALDDVVGVLANVVTPTLGVREGPIRDLPERVVGWLEAFDHPPAPLADDTRAWLSVVLQTLLLGKGFESLGLPAALGLHLLDVALVRRVAPRGPEGAVSAAAAASVLIPWWIFTSNRAIRSVLAARRARLAALWLQAVPDPADPGQRLPPGEG